LDDGNDIICSHDVALLLLDRDVSGAVVATIRSSPPVVGERTTAVGFGLLGDGQLPAMRQQRGDVEVLSVGATPFDYKRKDGSLMHVGGQPGELVTGEVTCNGDSGGPLFDAKGRVIGVTSRGLTEECNDAPSIFSDVASHVDLIERALAAAGHPAAAPPEAETSAHAPSAPGRAQAAPPSGTEGASEPAATGAPSAPEASASARGCTMGARANPGGFEGILILSGLLRRRRKCDNSDCRFRLAAWIGKKAARAFEAGAAALERQAPRGTLGRMNSALRSFAVGVALTFANGCGNESSGPSGPTNGHGAGGGADSGAIPGVGTPGGSGVNGPVAAGANTCSSVCNALVNCVRTHGYTPSDQEYSKCVSECQSSSPACITCVSSQTCDTLYTGAPCKTECEPTSDAGAAPPPDASREAADAG
jgi:hypothetical protein